MSYLAVFDATPEAERFALVRRWLDDEALPFVLELQARRPVLVTPVCTLVAKFQDVIEVLSSRTSSRCCASRLCSPSLSTSR